LLRGIAIQIAASSEGPGVARATALRKQLPAA